ncbi:MAG: thioredoxin family protein [Desulfobaccales bacterium]
MIDNRHPRPYVKARSRVLNAITRPLLLAGLLALVFGVSGAWAGGAGDANAANPGQTLELKSLPVKGKTTLLDFYSPFCPPCLAMAPVLDKLADKRADLAIRRVNINRPEVRGIDWRSPLAEQLRIRAVPYFMIFDPRGQLVAEGKAAIPQLKNWLREAGLLQEP